jgi:alpha-beta hydrolase superfamily lysophospholipase
MSQSDFAHTASDGRPIFVRRWLPSGAPKALLLVAHGLAEHSARYGRLAEAMADSGWAVLAPDHRGHGRSAGEGGLGWLAERQGIPRLAEDLHEIGSAFLSASSGIPLFLFGHSMGSLVAETWIARWGGEAAGCVLSGVLSPPGPPLLAFGAFIAAAGSVFKGQRTPSKLLHAMSFEASNKSFEPARTPVDWLSRDQAEVDKYAADPLCGFPASFGLYRDLFSAFSSLYLGGLLASTPSSLPLLILAGAEDPLGGAKGFADRLAGRYRAAGLGDVEAKAYPGARHEILNETNRDEVLADIGAWLESRLGAALAAGPRAAGARAPSP